VRSSDLVAGTGRTESSRIPLLDVLHGGAGRFDPWVLAPG
jgi:hypothetical protein